MAAIIFPLREKLQQTLFMQQRPKWTGGRRVITLPVLPWDDYDRPPSINFGVVDKPPIAAANVWVGYGLCATKQLAVPLNAFKQPPTLTSFSEQRFEPSVVHALKPMPATFYVITGVTRDSVGAILGSCTVNLYQTSTKQFVQTTTSDANTGTYYFNGGVRGQTYYVVAYKTGVPDVAGTSVNTLTPV